MYPQNPFFFVSSFTVRLKYGLYQFSNCYLTYMAQNPKNRVQKSLFSIFSFHSWFIYGMYQFLALTLTYRAQNPQNRVQKCRFLPYFHKKKFTFAQNQYFFATSCLTRFKYGLYQFLALTLTYRAQNSQNRLKIPKNTILGILSHVGQRQG